MKILYLTVALLLFLPLVSGYVVQPVSRYIIEINPEGSSGDVILATQILLEVDGGRAELSDELTDKEREDNLLLYISNGEVYLIEGKNYNRIIPQRLLQYVTKDNIPQKVVEEETETNNESVMECTGFERRTESCADSEGIVECACLNGEWICDYSQCEVVEEVEEVIVQVEEVEKLEEKKTVWTRIRNFFRNLFG